MKAHTLDLSKYNPGRSLHFLLWDNGLKGKSQIEEPSSEAEGGFDCIVLWDILLHKNQPKNSTTDILKWKKTKQQGN